MSWGEALRLTTALSTDPASHVAAALIEWDYPVSHEAIALMNLYDLQHHVAWAQGGGKGAKPKPHHRPWPLEDRRERRSRPEDSITQEAILEALRAAGHDAPLPDRR